MLSKTISQVLFGKEAKLQKVTGRSQTWKFPKADDNDNEREVTFRSEDGLILYLIKRIEKIEIQISELSKKK